MQIVLLDICIPIISGIVSLSFGCLSFDPLLNLAFGEAPCATDFESRDLLCRRQAVNRAFGDLQILGDSRRGKVCMVVLHASRSGESVYYRFIDQPFALERFRDEFGDLVIGPDLNRHIRKRTAITTMWLASITSARTCG